MRCARAGRAFHMRTRLFPIHPRQACNSPLHLRAANYTVHVLSDCITSYDTSKIDEMLRYYESKGSEIITLDKL